jgi:hypothetical protein
LGNQLAVVVCQIALFTQSVQYTHGGGADTQGVFEALNGCLMVAWFAC